MVVDERKVVLHELVREAQVSRRQLRLSEAGRQLRRQVRLVRQQAAGGKKVRRHVVDEPQPACGSESRRA